MARLLRQHLRLEELHIAVRIARHHAILSSRRIVRLRLPVAENLQRLRLQAAIGARIPARPSLHHLVGRLAGSHDERTLQPDVARVQRVHAFASVHLFAAYETERRRIGRIEALEFQQMPLQRVQRMVLELADRRGKGFAFVQPVQLQVFGARADRWPRQVAAQCGQEPVGLDALASRCGVPVGAVAGGDVAHGALLGPGEHVAQRFGGGGLRDAEEDEENEYDTRLCNRKR